VSHPELPRSAIPEPGAYAAAASWIRGMRERQLQRRPGEGLREHKKRMTRQQISDTATWMFAERGYNAVRISDVADAVGVSEKTVYNYFPTKESLVFDREEDVTAEILAALRARGTGISPVQAVVAWMQSDDQRYGVVPPEAVWMLRAFDDLITSTPELVAAQRAMTSRIIAAVAEALAEELELDPRDPEPQIVAHALMGLWELRESSMSRHIDDGLTGPALQAAVHADLARAARVLETGLWALHLVAQGRQVADAARAMNDARRQIAGAVREARDAWRAFRTAPMEQEHAAREAQREAQREERAERQAERRALQQKRRDPRRRNR
jgi:AcrR family transcriptional regulator